jgi:hypothetical protein
VIFSDRFTTYKTNPISSDILAVTEDVESGLDTYELFLVSTGGNRTQFVNTLRSFEGQLQINWLDQMQVNSIIDNYGAVLLKMSGNIVRSFQHRNI